ncbi:MAG: hypothetical protein RR964_02615 [Lachnospiraceae bacterium]
MNRKNYKTTIAMGMIAALAVTTIIPAVTYAKSPSLKEETVYAKMDGEGTVHHVIVTDQLKNITEYSSISDESALTDIQNIKGNETFVQKGNQLTWKGDKQDICYQGTTKQQLPVGVNITYLLNGEMKKPKELKGKSGHLQVHFEYENLNKQGEVYTPFLMATGMVLDNEKYTNIEVTGGKVLSDGERNLVVGIGIPKLKESLGSDLADLPDGFEVSAEVKNYDPLSITTIATNEFFNQLHPSNSNEMDTLEGEMNELHAASLQLVDGTSVLKNGMDELFTKSGEFTTAIPLLSEGSRSLAAGTTKLEMATKELSAGSSRLASGTQQLQEGSSRLQEGLISLNGGLEKAAIRTQQLASGAGQLSQGVNGLDTGAQQLQTGIQTMGDGMQNAAATLGNGTKAANCVLTSLQSMDTSQLSEADAATLQQAIQGVGQVLLIQEGVSQSLTSGALVNGISGLQGGVTSLQGGIGQVQNASDQLNGGLGSLTGGLEALHQGAVQAMKGGQDLYAGIENANQGAASVSKGSRELASGAGEVSQGAFRLDGGVEQLQTGSGQLIGGIQQLDIGAQALNTGMTEFHYTGIEQLTSVFQEDIRNMVNRMSKLLNTSKEYRNFSGISDDMEGTVKFIFITE